MAAEKPSHTIKELVVEDISTFIEQTLDDILQGACGTAQIKNCCCLHGLWLLVLHVPRKELIERRSANKFTNI